MKYAIIKVATWAFILLCCLGNVKGQQQKPTAEEFLKIALKKAAVAKKPVLLYCHGNANPWSAVMDSIIDGKPLNTILSKYYILVKMKTKENGWAAKHANLVGNAELFDRYFAKDTTQAYIDQAVPTFFVIGDKGKKMGQYSGYPEKIDRFIDLLAKTSKISNDEQAGIKASLNDAYVRNGSPTADAVLSNAIIQAKASHKKVFLMFHASWCHWCHVLDTAMNEPACKPFFNKNFVITHIVAKESAPHLTRQNLGADVMLAKYQGKERNGIPFWVVIDENGRWLADFNGFPAPSFEKEYEGFEDILRKTVNATDEELKAIKASFALVAKRNGV